MRGIFVKQKLNAMKQIFSAFMVVKMQVPELLITVNVIVLPHFMKVRLVKLSNFVIKQISNVYMEVQIPVLGPRIIVNAIVMVLIILVRFVR